MNAVLPGSDLLRISLLKVLGESADSGVSAQANKALYIVEQQQVMERKPGREQS